MTLNEYSLRKTGKHFVELSVTEGEQLLTEYKTYRAINTIFDPDLRIFG